MYRKDQVGRNRWRITFTDLQTGKTIVSPDLKSWHDASTWIGRHGRDEREKASGPKPPGA